MKALLLATALFAQPGPVIAPEALTDAHVRAAIDAIAAEIVTRKHPERFWEPETPPTGETSEPGGYTALTILALLHAGQTYQHPALRDAVSWLEQLAMDRTYPRTVRASLWAMLPPRFQDLLGADAAWLLESFQARHGGWTYKPQAGPTPPDNSITQFGALALWEAAKRGVRVDRRCWQGLEERFLSMQLEDGGWNYRGDGPSTGSMTAAGLATLFITQDLLHAEEFLTPGAAPSGRGTAQDAIARGLGWMDKNFSPVENPGRDVYYFYYLYGVERVGLASGYKHFGGHDWFRAAAAEVIRRLCRWDSATGTMRVYATHEGAPRGARVQLQQLDFALLLLCRGRVPVAVNKLSSEGVAWNNRPRDVANLVSWISEDTETALSWQVVSVESDPASWLDAPVLYFASHEGLPWAAGAIALENLRRYLDLGGLLLAVNEGSTTAFAASIEKAGLAMYPHLQFRALPPEHWAYNLLWPITDKRPVLSALGNGVRELIIVAPGDLSAAFQARDTDRPALSQTAAHVYLYGSEMNRPRPRLGAPETGAARLAAPATIVRAGYAGHWNPEPAALPRAARRLEATPGAVALLDRPLADIAAIEPAPALVVACGIEPHALSAAEQSAIRDYVGSGGVILFETPGGRGRFTADAERQCLELFPGSGGIKSLQRDRIITGTGLPGAAALARLDYRPCSVEVLGARETAPRLRGLLPGGQARVLFSREDISQALLDQTCWGVSGYAPAAAEALLRNIILHAQALRAAGG